MKRASILIVLFVLIFAAREASAALPGRFKCFKRIDRRLHGQLLDFTHNHGKDHRVYSNALCQPRDMYVYLPPCFSTDKQYPLAIFLHGASLDEQMFLTCVVQAFDKAMFDGKIPPCIIVAPDGAIGGQPSMIRPASWFANTPAGNFEDYIINDVYGFMMQNFPILPQREAHALIGVSMGGGAAVGLGIKHRDQFKIVIGIMPAVNLRWVDCHGRYQAPFDPCCWGWRSERKPCEIIGKVLPVPVTFNVLFNATIGKGPDAMARLAAFNPIELMDAYNLRDGELSMYLAYGGKDEFNIMAQVESFLYRARQRGVTVGVGYDPRGHHNLPSGHRLIPAALEWAAPQLQFLYADPGSALPLPAPRPQP